MHWEHMQCTGVWFTSCAHAYHSIMRCDWQVLPQNKRQRNPHNAQMFWSLETKQKSIKSNASALTFPHTLFNASSNNSYFSKEWRILMFISAFGRLKNCYTSHAVRSGHKQVLFTEVCFWSKHLRLSQSFGFAVPFLNQSTEPVISVPPLPFKLYARLQNKHRITRRSRSRFNGALATTGYHPR